MASPLPFAKCSLNEAGMGISLTMKVPGKKIPSPYTDALISNIDVFPTLCDILELEKTGLSVRQKFCRSF